MMTREKASLLGVLARAETFPVASVTLLWTSMEKQSAAYRWVSPYRWVFFYGGMLLAGTKGRAPDLQHETHHHSTCFVQPTNNI
jgi:hypothetical protein